MKVVAAYLMAGLGRNEIPNAADLKKILASDVQITTACTSSMITTFTPCFNYVTSSSGSGLSPTKDCCNALKSLPAFSMDCTCLIITGNVPMSIPFVNQNLAISLPRMCKSSVPLQCKEEWDAPGPRAGFYMCVHKKRALLFGGVVDMEMEGDVMMSSFLNEIYGFQLEPLLLLLLLSQRNRRKRRRKKTPRMKM